MNALGPVSSWAYFYANMGLMGGACDSFSSSMKNFK